jgi:thioredoxin 1
MVKLTEANFDLLTSAGKPTLVDFWAVWCGPCRIMDPVLEKLAAKYSDRILFGKVNVDEEMNISSRYQVFSIPTFMIFKNGQPMDAVIGAVGEASLERLLKGALDGGSA